MRYLAWPWKPALASQEMFVTPRAMADGWTKLHAERCPSHTGAALCCTPTAAPAQCFLFCESHFDCHVFAFISFPAPYMTHLQQDGGARAELGRPAAPFLASQPWFGQLSGRRSHGEELVIRLQELTRCPRGSWAQCCFTGLACEAILFPCLDTRGRDASPSVKW